MTGNVLAHNEVMVAAPQALSAAQRSAADTLAADLRRTFGSRIQALVAYGTGVVQPLHTLALVDRLTFEDLTACAPAVARWRQAGLAVPLILSRDEFDRSLDVFPLEYGAIVADHVTIIGQQPLANVRIETTDLRRACELQAKSHLIHLREGFLETQGHPEQVIRLIAASAPSLRALLGNIVRLEAGAAASSGGADDERLSAFAAERLGVPEGLTREVLACRPGSSAIAEPTALLGRYIAASERMWAHVDAWKTR